MPSTRKDGCLSVEISNLLHAEIKNCKIMIIVLVVDSMGVYHFYTLALKPFLSPLQSCLLCCSRSCNIEVHG